VEDEISSYRYDVVESFVLLRCHAPYVGGCLPTFQDNLLGPTFNGKAVQEQFRERGGFVTIQGMV
jgi:hypothetical protein